MPFLSDLVSVGSHHNAALLRALAPAPASFGELLASLAPPFDESTLGMYLRELDAGGLVSRYVETGSPLRVVYRLTEDGIRLTPAIATIALWTRGRLGVHSADIHRRDDAVDREHVGGSS